MTGLSRRQWLNQIGLAAMAIGAGQRVAAAEGRELNVDVAVFDAAIPESHDLATKARVRIETGLLRSTRWRALREAGLGPGCCVAGLTTWSDWTVVRGMLSGSGLRVRSEIRRADGLFQWVMA